MDRETLAAYVDAIINDITSTASVYAIISVNNNYEIRRVDVEANLQNQIKKLFSESLQGSILFNEDTSIKKLTECDSRRNVICMVDTDLGEQFSCINQLDGNHGDDLLLFKPNEELNSLKGLIIDIGNQQSQLLIYKHIYPLEILKPTRLAGMFTTNRLEKVNKDLLTISPSYQMIRVESESYIFDIPFVERNAKFQMIVKSKATQACQIMRNVAWIHNPTAMDELVDDISFARKLSRITAQSPVITKAIPSVNIIEFCKNFPSIKGKIRFNDDETKILLDTKVSKNLVIKIFLDDMLKSELTESHYESLAKDNVD